MKWGICFYHAKVRGLSVKEGSAKRGVTEIGKEKPR